MNLQIDSFSKRIHFWMDFPIFFNTALLEKYCFTILIGISRQPTGFRSRKPDLYRTVTKDKKKKNKNINRWKKVIRGPNCLIICRAMVPRWFLTQIRPQTPTPPSRRILNYKILFAKWINKIKQLHVLVSFSLFYMQIQR